MLLSKATYNCYVCGRTPLEQLGVKCLAQGHIGVSQWIQSRVSHTKDMRLILCAITTPKPILVNGEAIPTVSEKPVKSLGRWYDGDLKYTV